MQRGATQSETVVPVDEVPSGDGSTTRSYTRYMLPMASSRGGGRYMLYLVDTIGVKFADEFNPSSQEIDAEFALVRLLKTLVPIPTP